MYQFKIFVNGVKEVSGEGKVYHAVMCGAKGPVCENR